MEREKHHRKKAIRLKNQGRLKSPVTTYVQSKSAKKKSKKEKSDG